MKIPAKVMEVVVTAGLLGSLIGCSSKEPSPTAPNQINDHANSGVKARYDFVTPNGTRLPQAAELTVGDVTSILSGICITGNEMSVGNVTVDCDATKRPIATSGALDRITDNKMTLSEPLGVGPKRTR